MFLKLSFRTLKQWMVIYLNTFPKRMPRVSPTSVEVCPTELLFCFRGLASCSSSFCRTFMYWDSLGLDSTLSNFTALRWTVQGPWKRSSELLPFQLLHGTQASISRPT